eukprot:CAMPEP_0181470560 /NCGR_PEP_ID=MMETSP1110-20121109/38616_1 /TAXON_ID=174948 /ORGANISM="Symbiodinium sp., Strain CCMP421" /LENGTH=82 /DNA_ID=CAMNT_0023595539 /DNA_START=20 /DNA_END=266 /DNA_ORIENTATION=-
MIRGFVFALVWSQAAAGPLSGLLASLTGHDNATCADTHHACATSFAAFFPETAATMRPSTSRGCGLREEGSKARSTTMMGTW